MTETLDEEVYRRSLELAFEIMGPELRVEFRRRWIEIGEDYEIVDDGPPYARQRPIESKPAPLHPPVAGVPTLWLLESDPPREGS